MDTRPLEQARTTGGLSGPTARLQRRQLLQAAVAVAGAGLVGCGRRSAAPSRASAAAPITLGVAPPLPPPAYRLPLESTFADANHRYRIIYSSNEISGVPWWMIEAAAWSSDTLNLESTVKMLNFNPSMLIPGVWSSYADHPVYPAGRIAALPSRLDVVGVAYWPSALAAAGVSLPSPGWTFQEFEAACVQVQNALRKGSLAKYGVQFVLPRMTVDAGGLDDINIWGSFIVGFGGEIVTGGKATVTSSAAVAGITSLIDLVKRFGSDPAAPAPGMRLPSSVAMAFESIPPGAFGPNSQIGTIRYARFPNLPVRPVVPADIGGRGLAYLIHGPGGPAAANAAPQRILEAAGLYFSWFYEQRTQHLLATAGQMPMLAGLQKSFWAKYDMDVQASDFVFPDWAPYLTAVEPLPSLIPAVADPKQVPYILSQMAQRLNAGLMRAKLPSGAGGATPAQQASAARAFPTKGPGVASGGG